MIVGIALALVDLSAAVVIGWAAAVVVDRLIVDVAAVGVTSAPTARLLLRPPR